MKTDHENYIQGSIHVVPNFLWKHFFDILFSFPVISIWKVQIIIIIRRRKRTITITTSFRKLLTRDQHWFQGTICKQLPSLLYTFQAWKADQFTWFATFTISMCDPWFCKLWYKLVPFCKNSNCIHPIYSCEYIYGFHTIFLSIQCGFQIVFLWMQV